MNTSVSSNAILLTALLLTVLISSIGAVYARHESRRLFIELQALVSERDHLNIDWGRLQIEQSTWASPGRVEKMARDRLNMSVPDPSRVMIIRP